MNGIRQQARRTQTQQAFADLDRILSELDSRIVELAGIVKIVDERTVELGKGTAEAYNALSATVGQLQESAERRWVADAAAHAVILERFARVGDMTLWQRLRWIAVGR